MKTSLCLWPDCGNSHGPDNVYHPGEKASLDTGLYCEMVMSTRRKLLVPNALKDPDWDHNPDIDLGMISYCGLPITWPNGDIFGTICMLDEKENAYFQRAHHLMERFRDSIQQSLVSIYESSFARSQRDEAKNALRISEERLRLATTACNIGIWDWDVVNNILTWDDSMYALYGIRSEDFSNVYEAWSCMVSPENRQYAEAEIQAALRGEREYDIIHCIVRPNGEVRVIKVDSKTYFDEQGKPLRMVGTNIDITELKQAEDKFRTLTENAPVGIYMTDPSGNCVYTNKYWCDMAGISAQEALGLGWERVIYEEDLDFVRDNWYRSVQSGGRWGYEYRFLTPQGKLTWVYGTAFPLLDANDQLSGYIGTNIDITDRKRAEEEKQLLEQQLQHTQKLESLGILSGGIAHDFNNILAIIVGYCSLTKMDYETAENNIPEIEKAAERAAGLCRQMMAYAGKAQLTKTQINMCMMIDEMVSMLKATLPKNAEITSDLSSKIPYICADESQIRQIVMNLIINASEAISTEQGEIQVSLSRTTVTDGQATKDYHGTSIPLGEYVCLEVTDNGCGMDEATKWRIFEPFYTTKFAGRGLGMSAVLGIIKSHGGALQLFSKMGHGTTFKVYLPAQKSDSIGDEDSNVSIPSTPWRGSGTILLVEDEDQVRLIAKALLKNFGFTVLEAVNGKEALELYQRNATDITLVMTDMGMPIMDGYELFCELKKLNPELPIIVSSGYGDAEVGSRLGTDNIAGIISKPYGSDQLRELLKGVVEGIQKQT